MSDVGPTRKPQDGRAFAMPRRARAAPRVPRPPLAWAKRGRSASRTSRACPAAHARYRPRSAGEASTEAGERRRGRYANGRTELRTARRGARHRLKGTRWDIPTEHLFVVARPSGARLTRKLKTCTKLGGRKPRTLVSDERFAPGGARNRLDSSAGASSLRLAAALGRAGGRASPVQGCGRHQ